MRTDMSLRESETAKMAAKELRPGSRLRYEPPEVAGRGHAALVLDSVERTAEGRVVVKWSEGLLQVVLFDTNSDLPPLVEDEFDLIEWPDALSFDLEETVTVEIQGAAHG